MDHAEKVDQDAVLMARTFLLGSGRLETHKLVEAYRVLSVVSPLTYLPKLTEALLSSAYAMEIRNRPDIQLAFHTEAAETARRIDAGEPKSTDLLVRALDSYARKLFEAGRRAEGLAVSEEAAEAGRQGFRRGHVGSPVYGQSRLSVVLAEEGRHAEAVELCERAVEATREEGPDSNYFWPMVRWAAELDAAGRPEDALKAFTELLDTTRAGFDSGRGALAVLTRTLVHHAGMLDAAGHGAEACETRREALAVLTELSATGERRNPSNIHAWWTTLFALSGRTAEPVPSATAPGPAFGTAFLQWSPDIQQSYFQGLSDLQEQIAALRESARSESSRSELVALHRRFTIRSAIHAEHRSRRIEEPLRPIFDEGVDLARGLSKEVLGQALTDRAMFLLAVRKYSEAHDAFREACAVMN
ncbi:tetratricopeptide repeat protein [Streptomyces sp. NPDC047072]|uniref:tetratricopeptide repeat protein n=1 Tax=Streptomyces sp. NPDC047072 TaxID=3154809 RepID=UPI0033EAC60B